MSHVNIVTSDKGWILERLATEITKRLPYVRLSGGVDPSADIQYYVTYSSRKERVSPIEVGYFAHLEPLGEAREKFFEVARSVDHCVCHSQIYENLIREAGIERVSTISPGVDLEHFKPMVKIGVVGRTYHTGRKGEALVAQVMDIPGIDWHFTGEGWPKPALNIPDEGMSAFYNEMDYILVPATYEGGPMSVVEALACGTPVIAPPIGWVPKYPHIEYATGDAADLRRVLVGLVKERETLRSSVLDTTWDAWAEGHDRLFRALMKERGLTPSAMGNGSQARTVRSAALFMHGNEAKSMGGPTVRVPGTARALRDLGIDASAMSFPDKLGANVDIVHGFNVWSPDSALALARRMRELGKPFVLSPIFLDLSTQALWNKALPKLLLANRNPESLDDEIAALKERVLGDIASGRISHEPMPGYHAMVREIVSLADHVILLSEHERALLQEIGAQLDAATVVRNPVDPDVFGTTDAALFREAYGVEDYILCVARLEPRKNQALMLHALRDLNLPIVLMGHSGSDTGYEEVIKRYAGAKDNIHLLGRVDPKSGLVASAMAGARVVVLPSWCEGAPLAALEAGTAGASMVLSDRSSEREYFGSHARYCDPSSPDSLRTQILEAYDSPFDQARKDEVKAHVSNFSWQRYGKETADVYRRTLTDLGDASVVPAREVLHVAAEQKRKRTVIYDLTTSANHSGHWTGISRFEVLLALALAERDDLDIEFVVWRDSLHDYVRIPVQALRDNAIKEYVEYATRRGFRATKVAAGSILLVGGSAWMQSAHYPAGAVNFAHNNDLVLTTVFHDLIPAKFPLWFKEAYAPVFERNLKVMLAASRRILAVSDNTRRDVEQFAYRNNLFIPAIDLVREGDEIATPGSGTDVDPQVQAKLADRDFVLAVGAIHTRKNYLLLYNLWTRLVEKMGRKCPRLVIVGGAAWNGQELARAFNTDPQLADAVQLLEDIDDTTLDWLYRASIFTVYPSLYEGWGLPVGESLARGKICIASNTSSVPEIAPDQTDLIDPLDFSAWLARIYMYAQSRAAREAREAEIVAGYAQTPWARTAADLMAALGRGEAVSPFWNTCTPGRIQKLAEAATTPALRRQGWHRAESWGAWTSQLSARLTLRLSTPVGAAGGVLLLRGRVLLRHPGQFECTVRVADQTVGTLAFVNDSLQLFSLELPAALVSGASSLEIEFVSSHLISVAEFTNKPDRRSVGVGIDWICVVDKAHPLQIADYSENGLLPRDALVLGVPVDLLHDSHRLPILAGKKVVTDSAWGQRVVGGDPTLSLKLHAPVTEDLFVHLRYRAVATPEAPARLSVVIRDTATGLITFIGSITADDDQIQQSTLRIPVNIAVQQQPLLLEFLGDKLRTPKELALGADSQPFSLGFFECAVCDATGVAEPVRARCALGEILRFSSVPQEGETSGLPFLDTRSWHLPEEFGVWARGRVAGLRLHLPELPEDSALELRLGLVLPGDWDAYEGSPTLTVRVNGSEVWSRANHTGGELTIRAMLPATLIGDNGKLDIEIEGGKTFVPSLQTPLLTKDDRTIGIGLAALEILPCLPAPLDRIITFDIQNCPTGLQLSDGLQLEGAGKLSVTGAGGVLSLLLPSGIDGRLRVMALLRAEDQGAPNLSVQMTANEEAPVTLQLKAGGSQVVSFGDVVGSAAGRLDLAFASSEGSDIRGLVLEALFLRKQGDETEEDAELPAKSLALWSEAAAVPAQDLDFGEQVGIDTSTSDVPVLVGAWHAMEDVGTWLAAGPGGFRLRLPFAEYPAQLRRLALTLGPFPGASRTAPLELSVVLNGRPADRAVFPLSDSGAWVDRPTIYVDVAADVLSASRELFVTLVPSHASRPSDDGVNADSRELSVLVHGIRLLREGEVVA